MIVHSDDNLRYWFRGQAVSSQSFHFSNECTDFDTTWVEIPDEEAPLVT